MFQAGAVDRLARGEVVAAIEHHIGTRHKAIEFGIADALRHQLDIDIGIDAQQTFPGRLHLGPSDIGGGVEDLALQVGQVDIVVIDDREVPHAGGSQVGHRGRAKTARADDQHAAGEQALLAFDPDLVEQNMARIAQQLVVIHGSSANKNGPPVQYRGPQAALCKRRRRTVAGGGAA